MSNNVKILTGQTLLDIAIQQSGSLEGVFALAVLNGMPVTQILNDGQVIMFLSKQENPVIAKQFKDNDWKPASGLTGITQNGHPVPDLEGVDYWAIQVDFIVQ